jgi:hypothetical protein
MLTRQATALFGAVPLAVLITLAAAGCGTASAPSGAGRGTAPVSSAPPSSVPSPSATAPASGPAPIVPGAVECTGWPANVPGGPLPASFVPASALRCVTSNKIIPGKGEWLVADLERADTGLAPLASALRRPPGHERPGQVCPDFVMLPPQIILTSTSGEMIRPRLPVNDCGSAQPQVLAAIAALPWRTVSERLISQVRTAGQVASGCPAGIADPFALYGSSNATPGGALYASRPASLRVCVYETGTAAGTRFAGAATVTGTAETTLLTGLAGGRQSGTCTLPHSMYALVTGAGQDTRTFFVELGGCERVLRYRTASGDRTSVTMGQASTQAVRIIETVIHPKP